MSKGLKSTSFVEAGLKDLKEAGVISRFNRYARQAGVRDTRRPAWTDSRLGVAIRHSTATPMFRRYSAGSFTQATGINPSELESGGSNDDFKKVGQLADLVYEVGGDGWLGRHL